MVNLVPLAQPAEDADRVLDRRLVDQHRLETPLQSRVLFDVLAIFVQRGRADGAQLAARKSGLEQVGGVNRAFGRAGADESVQLVDEEDDLTVRSLDLLQHGLQPVLELASKLRACDKRAEIERDDSLAFEAFRNVALRDALGEAFSDRGLAHPWLADQNRVVLRPARKNLHDAANFFIAADHRVELAFLGQLGQVAAVLLEGLVFRLGVRIRDPLVAPDLAERSQQRLMRRARLFEDRLVGEGKQEVFGRDVLVLQALGFALRLLEVLAERLAQIWLRATADFWKSFDRRDEGGFQRLHGSTGALEQRPGDPLVLADKREQEMLGLHRLVSALSRQARSLLQRLEGLLREPFLFHQVRFSTAREGLNRLIRILTPCQSCLSWRRCAFASLLASRAS